MTQGFVRRAAIRAMRNSIPLTLPVADAARPARPDLNPRIEGLRIERIAVSPRESGASHGMRFCGARFFRARMRNPGHNSDPGNNDPGLSFGLSFRLSLGLSLRFHACLRTFVLAI